MRGLVEFKKKIRGMLVKILFSRIVINRAKHSRLQSSSLGVGRSQAERLFMSRLCRGSFISYKSLLYQNQIGAASRKQAGGAGLAQW